MSHSASWQWAEILTAAVSGRPEGAIAGPAPRKHHSYKAVEAYSALQWLSRQFPSRVTIHLINLIRCTTHAGKGRSSMSQERYRLTIQDILMSFRRRAAVIFLSFAIVSMLAVGVAVALPPVFKSTGIVLVESQEIPESLLPPTVTSEVDERFQLIQQRLMTRNNLFRIIDKYGLFTDEPSTKSKSDMLAAMQQRIEVKPMRSGRRGSSAFAFEISFEHRSPAVAQAVASELVTLFLNENARARTLRASETNEFLTREARKLETELADLEERLANHKQQFGDALPEHLSMRMGVLQRVEGDLRSTQRESKSTLEEIRILDVELSAARSGYQVGSVGSQQADFANTLSGMKQEYDRLRHVYTDRHPDVRLLSRRIEAFEESSGHSPESQTRTGMSEADLHILKVQTRLNAATERLASLQEQEQRLQSQIKEVEEQILKTPQVQRELTTIMRNYGNAQRKYEDIRAKQIDAQIAQSLEQQEKAERFSLLEPPMLPDTPIKPNRAKIMLLGFFFAAGSSTGLAFMLESLNRRLHGTGALTQLMGRPPLVVIPYITTTSEIRRRRGRRLMGLFAFLGLIAIAAVVTHVTYIPLDHLILKIAARVG